MDFELGDGGNWVPVGGYRRRFERCFWRKDFELGDGELWIYGEVQGMIFEREKRLDERSLVRALLRVEM
jgi:hypothetical protein